MFVLICLQFLLLLFGFSAVITQEVNIQCYQGVAINGQRLSSQVNGQVNCTGVFDKCGTVTFTSGSETVRMENCTNASTNNCDDTCDGVREYAKDQGFAAVSSCVATCCDSNMCNAPGKSEDKRRDLTEKRHDCFM